MLRHRKPQGKKVHMFFRIGQGPKDVVLGRREFDPEPPSSINFSWVGWPTLFSISVGTFQKLRRATPLMSNGSENKIELIKDIRGVTSLGLKEAKDVVEWFFANFSRDAQ